MADEQRGDSTQEQGPAAGWWKASDGMWYPPGQAPGQAAPPPPAYPPAYPPLYQPYGPAPGAPAWYPSPYVAPPSNGIATAALVCGIVGLVICLVPFGIFLGGILAMLGIVFGVAGISRARTIGTGRGMAIGGIASAVAGIVIGIVWLFAIRGVVRNVNDRIAVNPGDFEVTAETCTADRTGGLDATGTILNTTGDDKLLVFVHVRAINRSGTVVGTADSLVGNVDAHDSVPYAAHGSMSDTNVESFTCEVTVD